MGTLSVALGLLRLKELAKYRAYRLFCFSVLCTCHWFFFISVDHVNIEIFTIRAPEVFRLVSATAPNAAEKAGT